MTVILAGTQSNQAGKTTLLPGELIPLSWESVRAPRYSFGYAPHWELAQQEDGFALLDAEGATVARVIDITNVRAITLTELDRQPNLSQAEFSFADQPARRYIYTDHDTYIISVGRRAYRLDTYEQGPDVDLFLATVRFFQ